MPGEQLVLGRMRPEPSSPSLVEGGLGFPIRAVFFTVLTFLWCVSPAVAANYYVSPSGSDSNSGFSGSPWRTIQKAANNVAAGDTVLVAGGTYNEKVTITHSGTSGNPITFQNLNSTPAILDGTGVTVPTYDALLGISSASYVQLSGLTVRNSGYYGIEVHGASAHVTLTALDVNNNSNSGIWIETIQSTPNFITIQQSAIHDNAIGGITVWLAPGGYILIQGNSVYNNTGTGNYDGIQVGGGSGAPNHVVVRANQVYNNGLGGADQIDCGGHAFGDFYLVEDNDVWQTNSSSGVVKLQNTSGATTMIARRNRLTGLGFTVYGFPSPTLYYNNTIVNAGDALQIWNDTCISPSASCSLGGSEFKNNLAIGSSSYLLMTAGSTSWVTDTSYSSIRLAYNLYACTTHGIGWGTSDGSTVIYGCQSSGSTGQSQFAGYQAANPPNLQDLGSHLTTAALTSVFVNPAIRDYHLVAGSPAIDGGAPLTTATAAGSNSTTVPVIRSDYFQDGWGGLVAPDKVVVGTNALVQVTAVDHAGKTITVANPISWKQGDPVTLPYNGAAPDNGAFEFGVPSPVLVDVQPVPSP